MKTKSPKITFFILKLLIDKYDHQALFGDFDELYQHYAKDYGKIQAKWWLWSQIFKTIPTVIKNTVYWSTIMFANYLKIALRNIKNYKVYSFINIAGLTIGMVCCILILLWVQDELSYDGFHENGDNIYRVIQDIQFSDHQTSWAMNMGALGPAIKKDFPEIENTVRITGRRFQLRNGEKKFDVIVGLAEPSLFEIFSFPLIQGDPKSFLKDPRSILLSEDMVKKYFGDQNPIGQTINADGRFDFTVTGIFKNTPTNSHLQFDFIIPFIFGRELNYTVDVWQNSQFRTYVQIQDGIPGESVINKISNYLDDKPNLEENVKLTLQPLKRIHLYSNYDFDMAHGDITYVRIFFIIACFILLIACINFMNLATARAGNRAKEVGMRKVVGAIRKDLIKQFYSEALLIASISLFISALCIKLLLPAFNTLAGKEISLGLSDNFQILLIFSVITFLTGIISGSYPAILLSSFQPVKILTGKFNLGAGGSASILRRVLVVTQFSLSIMLVIGTLVVYNQLNYMKNKKLGFEKEQILTIVMRGGFGQKFETVKNELLQNPNIVKVTATSNLPTSGYSFSNSLWDWDGKNPDDEILMRAVFVDYDYFETFNMEMAQGRSYSKKFTTDTSNAIILNEAAVKAISMESPLGKRLGRDEYMPSIIGVVKNYHFRSLRSQIEPLVILLVPQNCNYVCVKIKSADMPATIDFIEKKWQAYSLEYPFLSRFLDDRLEGLYRGEQRIGKIVLYFTILAIFISSLGLFGLASFMAEKRTKEIGIRKVLGASVSGILMLLYKEFSKWILIANLIAWPAAYFLMDNWLKNFAFRTNLGFSVFMLSAGIALFISLLTVSYQSIKAANSNPVNSLKYE